jgi:hypothetical protein
MNNIHISENMCINLLVLQETHDAELYTAIIETSVLTLVGF